MSVGISEIDDDHKIFINLLNRFNQSIVDRMSISEIKNNLQDILSFIEQHSIREEALLKQHGYPDEPDHALVHQLLKDTLHQIMQSVRHTSVDYLWIDAGLKVKQEKIKHLVNEDMKYINYFKNQKNKLV